MSRIEEITTLTCNKSSLYTDRKNFPINAGWKVERCDMSQEQMYNFSGRCFKQLRASNIDNMCKLAELLRVQDRSTREKAFKAIRASQIAGTQYWGSPSSGLQQILKEPRPGLDSLQKFAPKVTILIKAVMKDGVDEALNTKHFVYSAYTSTITHLGQTLESVRSDQGNPIFKQLKADDFEWQDGAAQTQLTLKPKPMSDVRRNPDAIVFISLKGSKDEKRKLMAAFGFVTPDGDRFEGLYRDGSRSVPLVQVMLGARETNQGLTFLRLQHIHVMEPNPKGWGQIVQTIGRGIRRGTHEGLIHQDMRTVKTTIYSTSIDERLLDAAISKHVDAVTRNLADQHRRYHEQYRALEQDDLTTKIENSIKKNLRTFAANIQKLSSDKSKVKCLCLFFLYRVLKVYVNFNLTCFSSPRRPRLSPLPCSWKTGG